MRVEWLRWQRQECLLRPSRSRSLRREPVHPDTAVRRDRKRRTPDQPVDERYGSNGTRAWTVRAAQLGALSGPHPSARTARHRDLNHLDRPEGFHLGLLTEETLTQMSLQYLGIRFEDLESRNRRSSSHRVDSAHTDIRVRVGHTRTKHFFRRIVARAIPKRSEIIQSGTFHILRRGLQFCARSRPTHIHSRA